MKAFHRAGRLIGSAGSGLGNLCDTWMLQEHVPEVLREGCNQCFLKGDPHVEAVVWSEGHDGHCVSPCWNVQKCL